MDQNPKALEYLESQYSLRDDARRNTLYREFHTLKLSAKRSVEDFNSAFNEVLSRLAALRVDIDPKDTANQYLFTVERSHPQWVERQRSALRQAAALGQSFEKLNLHYLQSDLAEETRSKSASGTTYGAERKNRGTPQGNKHNKDGKKRKKGWKDRYGSSNPSENQNHSFWMGTFQMGPDSDSDEDFNSSSVEEVTRSGSERVVDLCHGNNRLNKTNSSSKKPNSKKAKKRAKPTEHAGRKIAALLYDTGSTDHIINDR